MRQIVVVSRQEDWPLVLPGVDTITASEYLTQPEWSELRSARVYNLCRSYRYQANGYYVSLLAAARGHKPLPSIGTIQDFKTQNVIRISTTDLNRLISICLKPLQSSSFVLSLYFGRNMARRYDPIASALFNLFPAPLLRAEFERLSDGWILKKLAPMAFADVPEGHLPFLTESAKRYFAGHRPRAKRRRNARFDLAMLVNPQESDPPSDEKALQRFEQAAEEVGFNIERIGPDEIGRLAEFDALFIRETTAVNHHTFRFARRAAAEGLVVIDDPDSILKCTNKVYLAELLQRNQVDSPRTLLVHRDNAHEIEQQLGLPVVLKQPDSAFSLGVVKARDADELRDSVQSLLKHSDLIVAQAYLPTSFDWRVGLIDGRPLYACRYHMARGHWQIIHRDGKGTHEGQAETLSVGEAPAAVIQTALKAANLIGNGLYGVDLKEVDGKILVIEVNDNPSIDAGVEDAVLKHALYREIMGVMFNRVKARKLGAD